jgi:vancomycin resistance protein YoaR
LKTRSLEALSATREDLLEAFLHEGESVGKFGKKRRRSRGRFVAPVLVLCALVAAFVALDYWSNSGKIYRGVSVGAVALGGKTPEEARALVQERTAGPLREMRLAGAGGGATLPASEVGVRFDVEGTVEQAYAVGREGSLVERLADRLSAAWGSAVIPPAVEYRPAAARAEIEALASRLDRPPREGSVAVVGGTVQVEEAREGYETDVDATLANVGEAVEEMRGEARVAGRVLEPRVSTEAAEAAGRKARAALSGPVTLRAEGQEWVLSPEEIGQSLVVRPRGGMVDVSLNEDALRANLGDMYAALTVEPVEAGYRVVGKGKVEVVPGRAGKRIQEDKLFDQLRAGLFGTDGRGGGEGRDYEVPIFTAEPDLTTAEAERLRPTTLLGSYRTNYLTYDDSPGRVTNLQIASDAVNGTMLAPGEIFSFNELAAPLDYEESKVIVKGRVDTAEGGGLCQVSSTLYMAANLAGLDVIERHPHYAELPYIRPGFDATVWFGALDMKFENDSPGYLLLLEWVDEGGYVNAAIYGRPSGKEVEMASRKVSTKQEGDNTITKWVTTQRMTQNGKVLFDGVLHTDVYQTLKPQEATTTARPPN